MSDSTPVTLIFYSFPAGKQKEIEEILSDEGLSSSYSFGQDFDAEPLTTGERYGDDSGSLNAYLEIGNKLIEVAPDATFVIWSDPKYEWDGGIVMYAPDLGRWVGDCDADGNPHFTSQAVRAMVIAQDKPIEELVGLPWLDRFEELSEVPVG